MTAELSPDDDEDWLQELVTCHRPPLRGGSAPARNDDSDDEWWSELLFQRRGVPQGTARQANGSRMAGERHRAAGSEELALHDGRRRVATHQGAAGVSAAAPHSGQFALFEQWIEKVRAWGPAIVVDMPAQDAIVLSVPAAAGIDGEPVQHCCRRLASWLLLMRPAIFKIGIAADVHERFFSEDIGYRHVDGIWRFMDVIWQGPASKCRQMEIDLIKEAGALPGCYNIRGGGDGVRPDREHDCFVYVVLACAADGPDLRRACDNRRSRARRL